MSGTPADTRVRVRRKPQRADYSIERVEAILDVTTATGTPLPAPDLPPGITRGPDVTDLLARTGTPRRLSAR